MSIWNDAWVCVVRVKGGFVEGNNYYFTTEEKAEAFRRSIVTEKDVMDCWIQKNPDYEEEP